MGGRESGGGGELDSDGCMAGERRSKTDEGPEQRAARIGSHHRGSCDKRKKGKRDAKEKRCRRFEKARKYQGKK